MITQDQTVACSSRTTARPIRTATGETTTTGVKRLVHIAGPGYPCVRTIAPATMVAATTLAANTATRQETQVAGSVMSPTGSRARTKTATALSMTATATLNTSFARENRCTPRTTPTAAARVQAVPKQVGR